MSLPTVELDDHTFQQIVDEAKRRIGRRCPEWTDHNVSDPGVTLIELFAWMTELTLYRLNQVPEKNYRKFLEMIGVSLESPAPALTDLRFRLSLAIEDREGQEAFTRTLKARETVAATLRTETEEAIEFATDIDLQMVRPRMFPPISIPAPQVGETSDDFTQGGIVFESAKHDRDEPARMFALFSPVPREGDALYLGFESNVSNNLIQLEANCRRSAATQLDEDYPSQIWEFWNGAENRWDPFLPSLDTTYGFNRPPQDPDRRDGNPNGLIELPMPAGLQPRLIGEYQGYWVRCRYATELPPRGVEQRKPKIYDKSPLFRSLVARTVGGTVPASNSTTIAYRDLGQSDGEPGQVFSLGVRPILPRRPGETVLVGVQGEPYELWEPWEEVEDFCDSDEDDRHFVCDSYAGEILFGPRILEPNGVPRQYGAIPPQNYTIAFSAFRYGGGGQGNVAAGQVCVLKSSIPYIADVSNPIRADAGREQESLERAKMRGRSLLRMRDRAVTAEDYEYLAGRATSGVGRARCIQPIAVHASEDGKRIPPGVVKVLLVPALDEKLMVPRPIDLRVPERVRQEVETYLDRRRLLTTVLEVGEPVYVYVSTHITLVADPKADDNEVARAVKARLERYLHPLVGGPTGEGWPFRRTLTLADIYAQVGTVRGVAFLLDARMYVSRSANLEEGTLRAEQSVSNRTGVVVKENELLCTREHRIIVKPLSAVGEEERETA